MNVLIADDEAVSRLIVKKVVEDAGHRAVLAVNGAEAMLLFERAQPDVVLADWQMPELSGVQLCQKIRALRRQRYTYVAIITSQDDKTSCIEALDAGADDFMSKPITPGELSARLKVAKRILELQAEVTQMRGLLSICSYCKKIREGEAWVAVEQYVGKRSDASFSHGICPSCFQQHYPDG
ncbi:MAG: response regulator [Deltaproteobacteria bacterium]|nr:response regulator [Deltaproteobacteria bacterium]